MSLLLKQLILLCWQKRGKQALYDEPVCIHSKAKPTKKQFAQFAFVDASDDPRFPRLMNTKVWHHRTLISQYKNLKGQFGACIGNLTLFPLAAETSVSKPWQISGDHTKILQDKQTWTPRVSQSPSFKVLTPKFNGYNVICMNAVCLTLTCKEMCTLSSLKHGNLSNFHHPFRTTWTHDIRLRVTTVTHRKKWN